MCVGAALRQAWGNASVALCFWYGFRKPKKCKVNPPRYLLQLCPLLLQISRLPHWQRVPALWASSACPSSCS